MPIVAIVITLLVVGVLLWLLNTRVTIVDATVKQIINVVVIVFLVIWVLKAMGLLDYLFSITI